jgi:hypothetical protein
MYLGLVAAGRQQQLKEQEQQLKQNKERATTSFCKRRFKKSPYYDYDHDRS